MPGASVAAPSKGEYSHHTAGPEFVCAGTRVSASSAPPLGERRERERGCRKAAIELRNTIPHHACSAMLVRCQKPQRRSPEQQKQHRRSLVEQRPHRHSLVQQRAAAARRRRLGGGAHTNLTLPRESSKRGWSCLGRRRGRGVPWPACWRASRCACRPSAGASQSARCLLACCRPLAAAGCLLLVRPALAPRIASPPPWQPGTAGATMRTGGVRPTTPRECSASSARGSPGLSTSSSTAPPARRKARARPRSTRALASAAAAAAAAAERCLAHAVAARAWQLSGRVLWPAMRLAALWARHAAACAAMSQHSVCWPTCLAGWLSACLQVLCGLPGVAHPFGRRGHCCARGEPLLANPPPAHHTAIACRRPSHPPPLTPGPRADQRERWPGAAQRASAPRARAADPKSAGAAEPARGAGAHVLARLGGLDQLVSPRLLPMLMLPAAVRSARLAGWL